jgi:NAD(P)-dependent dehydrogenase (short-subunit alcohol dehydrogenase family)
MSGEVTLEGRSAIVTGAGGGLGKAEALGLAAAGARLVANDLNAEALQANVEEITAAGGQAVAVAGDIGEWETGQKLVAGAVDSYGQLDILVNNAGLVRDRMVFSMSAEEWDLVVRVHLRGHFVTTRFATAYWRDQSKKAGGPVYARVVNTTSEAFLFGSPGQPNYAAAKAGITTLTLSTARGCARYGVRANAIAPRARTAMTADLMSAPEEGGQDPLAPEHVVPLVAYLSSPAAAGINGEVFVVHGGVAALMAAPSVKAVARASEHGSPDGMWTLDSVAKALGPLFGDEPAGAGFACDETAGLADETIGFPSKN